MPPVIHNYGHSKDYHCYLSITEPDEIKEDVPNVKNKKTRMGRQFYQISAKNKHSSTTDDATPRRSKRKFKNRAQVVPRIKNLTGLETSKDYDLPTVLPDYSSKYEDEYNKKLSKKTRKVHRPWRSPTSDSSDSETPLNYSSPVVTGVSSIDSFLGSSSPIVVHPGDPTPPGLYAYTPLGFNGYPRYNYKCVYCSKLFESATTLYEHCNDHHNGDKPYECPFCREKFAYNLQYAEHLNKHILNNSFPTYKCEICSIGFCSVWELKLHFATHTNVMQFQYK